MKCAFIVMPFFVYIFMVIRTCRYLQIFILHHKITFSSLRLNFMFYTIFASDLLRLMLLFAQGTCLLLNLYVLQMKDIKRLYWIFSALFISHCITANSSIIFYAEMRRNGWLLRGDFFMLKFDIFCWNHSDMSDVTFMKPINFVSVFQLWYDLRIVFDNVVVRRVQLYNWYVKESNNFQWRSDRLCIYFSCAGFGFYNWWCYVDVTSLAANCCSVHTLSLNQSMERFWCMTEWQNDTEISCVWIQLHFSKLLFL